MRYFLSLSICLFAASFLSGCYSSSPNPMARGYSSFNKEFKSVGGASARDVGYEYSHEKNKAVLENMSIVAKDLVEKLDKKLTFGIDEVYLIIPANTAFYNSFDYLLRDELMKQGYLLANSSDDAVSVELVANEIASHCEGHNDVYLALAIDVVDGMPRDVVGGFYDVELYDYKKAGIVKIDIPACDKK